MLRWSIFLATGLFAAASAKHHSHAPAYSTWEGYQAGQLLPDTRVESSNTVDGSCTSACQHRCYGTYEVNGQCYSLYVDPGSNYTLPSDGSISWKFAQRDCNNQNQFIDYVGSCRDCPATTHTTSDGAGCVADTVVAKAAAVPVRAAVSMVRRQHRHRIARRERIAKEMERRMAMQS